MSKEQKRKSLIVNKKGSKRVKIVAKVNKVHISDVDVTKQAAKDYVLRILDRAGLDTSAASILNAMTVTMAKTIYEREKKNLSVEPGGCICSLRKTSFGYVSVHLSKTTKKMNWPNGYIKTFALHKDYAKAQGTVFLGEYQSFWSSKMRVMLHQIAFRAGGNELPSWETGIDLAHSCQRGGDGCFALDHINAETHSQNMESRGCQHAVKCGSCQSLTKVCSHGCTPPADIRDELQQQDGVVYFEAFRVLSNGAKESIYWGQESMLGTYKPQAEAEWQHHV
jgi:hypothetical protein